MYILLYYIKYVEKVLIIYILQTDTSVREIFLFNGHLCKSKSHKEKYNGYYS